MTCTNDENTLICCKAMVFSKLFHTGKFEVPWHQRYYDWEQYQVSELLDDIDEAINENRKCYFLGSIVLVKRTDGVWDINDGQQRMVTFSLICACLCRLFRDESESLYEGLALRVMFDVDTNNTKTLSQAQDLEPRLTPPIDDKIYYEKMIRDEGISTNGKLSRAWSKIDAFVDRIGLEGAKKYLEFLLDRVEVACLEIPKEDVDPNSLFETINCRGKTLSDFDLIRNYLYSHFNTEEEKTRRDTVHDNIENIRTIMTDDKNSAKYSRCYFQCRYGYLPEKIFYRETRKKIRTHLGKNNDYVYNLINSFTDKGQLELFRLIVSPNENNEFIKQFLIDSNKKEHHRRLSVFLQELSRYTVVQPIIFAFLYRYLKEPKENKRKVANQVHKNIRKITSFIMRTAFVANVQPALYDSYFSSSAKEIWSTSSLKDINIMKLLEECDGKGQGIIKDSKFIEKMKIVEIKEPIKARILLTGVNNHIQHDGELINEKKCTLEHILPQSSVHWSGWEGFKDKNKSEWIHRIGNLTLVGREDNKPGNEANENFCSKMKFLERSAISINKNIVKVDDWSPDEINKRQLELSELAAKVWSFE